MSLANLIIPRYTFDDWVQWEGKWELIEGHPIAMSPTPIPAHQRVASEIRTELTLALRRSACTHCRAYDPIDYKISDNTIVIPDILVICGEVKKRFLDFPPVLIAEVLSPATAIKDKHTKYELYQQQGVLYYLIVDVDKKNIEIYQLVKQEYQLLNESVFPELQLEGGCAIRPNFQHVFD